jgi:hypothetical protein
MSRTSGAISHWSWHQQVVLHSAKSWVSRPRSLPWHPHRLPLLRRHIDDRLFHNPQARRLSGRPLPTQPPHGLRQCTNRLPVHSTVPKRVARVFGREALPPDGLNIAGADQRGAFLETVYAVYDEFQQGFREIRPLHSFIRRPPATPRPSSPLHGPRATCEQ